FEIKFQDKFAATFEEKGSSFIEGLFIESIQYDALSFFLEKLGGGTEIKGKEFAGKIEEYFLTSTQAQQDALIYEFFYTRMNRILLRYAESFFTGPMDIYMRFDYNPSTQIGWEHETFSFMFIASYFLKAFD
ncbi:unnamed protein product, partial [marine sediment metagenome]